MRLFYVKLSDDHQFSSFSRKCRQKRSRGRAKEWWYLATGFFVQLPLDSPYITMVKMARITKKSMSPSTIFLPLSSFSRNEAKLIPLNKLRFIELCCSSAEYSSLHNTCIGSKTFFVRCNFQRIGPMSEVGGGGVPNYLKQIFYICLSG